jgi:hypothetical protein
MMQLQVEMESKFHNDKNKNEDIVAVLRKNPW